MRSKDSVASQLKSQQKSTKETNLTFKTYDLKKRFYRLWNRLQKPIAVNVTFLKYNVNTSTFVYNSYK